MNPEQASPPKNVLVRSASVLVNCDKQNAFDFISSGPRLSEWLTACGPVPGAKSVEVLTGTYNQPGNRRKVTFANGDTAIEELMTFHPPGNYSYSISHFSNFLKHLSKAAYGQCWFDNAGMQTRITWTYSFSYKNLWDRIVLSLFLTFTYKRFMKHSLANAKAILDKSQSVGQ